MINFPIPDKIIFISERKSYQKLEKSKIPDSFVSFINTYIPVILKKGGGNLRRIRKSNHPILDS